MGTDIHGTLRVKNWKNKWEYHKLPEYFDNRDYDFFAILADVRNGYGFAGVTRYDKPVIPFTSGRGFPEDAPLQDDDDTIKGIGYIGDHSYGYITLQELRESFHLAEQKVMRSGVVSIKEYEELNGANPTEWSGMVTGKLVVLNTPNDITPETTHVHLHWEDQPFLHKMTKLKEWMELYQPYRDKDGTDVQLLFGFDS